MHLLHCWSKVWSNPKEGVGPGERGCHETAWQRPGARGTCAGPSEVCGVDDTDTQGEEHGAQTRNGRTSSARLLYSHETTSTEKQPASDIKLHRLIGWRGRLYGRQHHLRQKTTRTTDVGIDVTLALALPNTLNHCILSPWRGMGSSINMTDLHVICAKLHLETWCSVFICVSSFSPKHRTRSSKIRTLIALKTLLGKE